MMTDTNIMTIKVIAGANKLRIIIFVNNAIKEKNGLKIIDFPMISMFNMFITQKRPNGFMMLLIDIRLKTTRVWICTLYRNGVIKEILGDI